MVLIITSLLMKSKTLSLVLLSSCRTKTQCLRIPGWAIEACLTFVLCIYFHGFVRNWSTQGCDFSPSNKKLCFTSLLIRTGLSRQHRSSVRLIAPSRFSMFCSSDCCRIFQSFWNNFLEITCRMPLQCTLCQCLLKTCWWLAYFNQMQNQCHVVRIIIITDHLVSSFHIWVISETCEKLSFRNMRALSLKNILVFQFFPFLCVKQWPHKIPCWKHRDLISSFSFPKLTFCILLNSNLWQIKRSYTSRS